MDRCYQPIEISLLGGRFLKIFHPETVLKVIGDCLLKLNFHLIQLFSQHFGRNKSSHQRHTAGDLFNPEQKETFPCQMLS